MVNQCKLSKTDGGESDGTDEHGYKLILARDFK